MALRTLIARVRCTPMGPLQRLIGSLDVHGKGTLHPLHDVDPVVLWDTAKIKGVGLPGFGMHPHYGVIACTYVVEGAVKDGDNLGASHGGLTEAGGIYCASSGRGVCHEEATAVENNQIMQVVVRIPLDKMEFAPSITKAEQSQLPTLHDGKVTVVVGELDGAKSPATPKAWPDAAFLRVSLSAGQTLDLALPERFVHGALYVISGKGIVGAQPVGEQPEVFVFGAGQSLALAASDAESLDVFIVVGAPMKDEPWVKKLGNNGFGVFRNETEATDIMGKAVAAGVDWSYKILDAK